jgi:hypothetical protein
MISLTVELWVPHHHQKPLNSTCLKSEMYVHNFYHFDVVQYPEDFTMNISSQWYIKIMIWNHWKFCSYDNMRIHTYSHQCHNRNGRIHLKHWRSWSVHQHLLEWVLECGSVAEEIDSRHTICQQVAVRMPWYRLKSVHFGVISYKLQQLISLYCNHEIQLIYPACRAEGWKQLVVFDGCNKNIIYTEYNTHWMKE